jgi:hypothetical protein
MKKLNKIKTENWIKIWGHFWYLKKTLGESYLINFIS